MKKGIFACAQDGEKRGVEADTIVLKASRTPRDKRAMLESV